MKARTKKPKYEVNSDLMHEVCDRTFVIMETLGEHVCEHQSVKAEPEIGHLASAAFDALFALYQASGLRMADLAEAERARNPGKADK